MNNNVSVGWASKVGYLLTVLGGAATAWASAAHNPSISPETLLIVTIAAGVLTNIGRQYQAAKVSIAPPDELPPALVGAPVATTVPADGVDGPTVAHAQPSAEQ